jgi:NSS family neurotransmitter:Na+ symporter
MPAEPATRSRFATRIGFVLSGIGAAVGLGNIWRFPQLTSENGGAAFVLVYVAALVLLGIPLLWAELAVGQRAQQSSIRAVESVGGRAWRFVGILFVATSTIFLGYYVVLSGVALKYALFSTGDQIASNPAGFLAEASEGLDALLFAAIFMAITVGIVSAGVAKGLERANLVMMPLLFVMILGLALYALTRSGAGGGVEFYLSVDFGEIRPQTILDAIGQVFFSVGIAFGIMLTYASYTSPGRSMLGSATTIATADMLVALTAGLMVFPLIFAQGLESQVIEGSPGSKDALFITMATAFASIGGGLGKLLMVVFFALLCFAALSSTIAGLEVIVSYVEDTFGWVRWRAAVVASEFSFLIGVFAATWEPFFDYLNDYVIVVTLVAGGVGLALLFAFGVKDKVGLLLGGETDAPRWKERVAHGFVWIIAVVAPALLIVIILLTLPCTINGLFFTDVPTPTC